MIAGANGPCPDGRRNPGDSQVSTGTARADVDHHDVIVGGGFSGIGVAIRLDRAVPFSTTAGWIPGSLGVF